MSARPSKKGGVEFDGPVWTPPGKPRIVEVVDALPEDTLPISPIVNSSLVGGPFHGEVVTNEVPLPDYVVRTLSNSEGRVDALYTPSLHQVVRETTFLIGINEQTRRGIPVRRSLQEFHVYAIRPDNTYEYIGWC